MTPSRRFRCNPCAANGCVALAAHGSAYGSGWLSGQGACNTLQGHCCGCGNVLTGRSTSRRLTALTVSSSRLPRGRRGPPLRTITGCFQGGIAAARAAAAATAAAALLAALAGCPR